MQKIKNGQKKSAFLLKTYDILQNDQYGHIVSWHYDGIGFVINNIQKFTQNILPLYFKHSNFASFIRQLNMYGFSKKRSAKSENYYYHAKFQKNQKDLVRQIQRKMQKKSNKSCNKTDSHEEIKISSELSIQLESKNQTTKKKQEQASQNSFKAKLLSLININQQLINIQFQSLIQILKDLDALKNQGASYEQKVDLQNIFSEYIETHHLFITQIKQRANTDLKQNGKIMMSNSKLQTQESLKDKRQGDTSTRQQSAQRKKAEEQKVKRLGQI